MSRKKKLILNTLVGVFKQFVVIICGFILPRYTLLYFGSSVNGLVSSIVNFLSFITLLDMGVGAVIQSNLYEPLAKYDKERLSSIIKSSEKFFRHLAYIFIGYVVFLCIYFPKLVNTNFNTKFTVTLIIIISVSTLFQYFIGITYQLLLNADQKSYVQLLLQIITVILNTLLSVLLMKNGASIIKVKLISTIVFILRPLGQIFYVKKNYDLDKNIVIDKDPIIQKWNGFSQHLASVVCQNIDIAVLTIFSSLKNISIYSVYYMIVIGIQQLIMNSCTGLESLFGNLIALDQRKRLNEIFIVIEWGMHTIVTIIFSITAITIIPFVLVYTRGITDASYNEPEFAILLVIAYALQCLRVPYFRIIKAARHFKETQNGAYISALINIALTISLVFNYGLIGAAIGTVGAMLYHTGYFVWYLNSNLLNRSYKFFLRYLIIDFTISLLSYLCTKDFVVSQLSYMCWIIYALKVSAVVILISIVINFLFFKNKANITLKQIKERVIK